MEIYTCTSFLLSKTINHSILQNLLSVGLHGFFALLFLLIFCFLGVHILLLARIGWIQQTQKTQERAQQNEERVSQPKNVENKAPATSQEPIYYIVERKTKRAKSSYGEPKQFRFK